MQLTLPQETSFFVFLQPLWWFLDEEKPSSSSRPKERSELPRLFRWPRQQQHKIDSKALEKEMGGGNEVGDRKDTKQKYERRVHSGERKGISMLRPSFQSLSWSRRRVQEKILHSLCQLSLLFHDVWDTHLSLERSFLRGFVLQEVKVPEARSELVNQCCRHPRQVSAVSI